MSNSSWQDDLAPLLRTARIIVAALVAGCVAFLVIAVFVAAGQAPQADPPIITYVAVAVAALAAIMRAVVPGIIVASGRRQILEGTEATSQRHASAAAKSESRAAHGRTRRLGQLFVAKTIISAALLEGAVFFALVAHLVETSFLSLLVALLLILALVLHVPTRSGLERWIEDQTVLLEQERHLRA